MGLRRTAYAVHNWNIYDLSFCINSLLMIPSSLPFSRVTPLSMPSKDASAQKANRERLKAEKEERRRLGRERANESRERRRADPELHAAEFEVEVTTSIEVEEKEDPDAKWNINDIACFEDARVGEPIE